MDIEFQHKLKLAIVVSETTLPSFIDDLITWAQAQALIEISHILFVEETKSLALSDRLSQVIWRLIARPEIKKLKKSSPNLPIASHNLKTLLTPVININDELIPADIQKINLLKLDLVIDFTQNLVSQNLIKSCNYGVIKLSFANSNKFPPCFLEVLKKAPYSYAVIEHFSQDATQVIFKGAFPTESFWIKNLAQVQLRAYHYLKQTLLTIAGNKSIKTTHLNTKIENLKPCKSLLFAQITYLFNRYSVKLNKFSPIRLMKRKQRWGVAFAKKPWRNLDLSTAHKIKNPIGHFLADPFVISVNNKDYCFVEDYDYAKKLGNISVYELLDDNAKLLGEALAESFHLSFPYLFQYEGKYFMLPETNGNKDIRIYECVEFPLKWELKKIIMNNVSAADSMLFQHGKHWWLFTNLNPTQQEEHCSELYAFYALEPFSDKWIPHELNPIIVDASCARNGGIIIEANEIYRTAQRQGFNQYGAGSSLRKIIKLTPDTYHEELIHTINPDFFEDLLGTHHFHCNNNVTVFDFVKRERIKLVATKKS